MEDGQTTFRHSVLEPIAKSIAATPCFVLEATKAQLKAAEIANEGITLEYDSGNTRTTLELIQSRSLLLDARISFARAERDFVVSQFELAKQIGTLSVNSLK